MTRLEMQTLVQQILGNRSSTALDAAWYQARVDSANRRLCTFQGFVMRPGIKQQQKRVLRFYELMDADTQTISTGMSDNVITPVNTTNVFAILDVYDDTNKRWLERISPRAVHRRDRVGVGVPREWAPDGTFGNTVRYRVYPIPDVSTDEISALEYTYRYPATLAADGSSPEIPEEWHMAIVYAAANEAAKLVRIPELAAEMEASFLGWIAERRSPMEETARGGGRRYIGVTG